MSCSTSEASSYRIEVSACPAAPGYYRWTVLQEGHALDLPGYAYASAWSAGEAARIALHWHLVLDAARAAAPEPGEAPLPAARATDRRYG